MVTSPIASSCASRIMRATRSSLRSTILRPVSAFHGWVFQSLLHPHSHEQWR
jgi:hypothetical protein